ncbi:MAG: outer membrane beta-barrel protein [Proteobacteria bacterium]|nr:outer membrane beta-barrel protein [Pseudomonadota bacterium]
MRFFPALLMVLLLILVPTGAAGEGWSLYLGLQTVSFGSDLGDYYDIPAGAGPALTIGIPPLMGLLFDFNFGMRNTSDETTREDVEYRWMEFGPRFPFGRDGARIQPEFFAGAGIYDLKIGDVDLDTGGGVFAGFGVEDFISDKVSGRFRVKAVYWESETYNTNAPSLNFSLMYGYHF